MLQSLAQVSEILVHEHDSEGHEQYHHDMGNLPEQNVGTLHVVSPEEHEAEHSLDVEGDVHVDIIVVDLPGAPPGTKDPELVVEDEEKQEEVKEDKKPKNKWDWSHIGHDGFIDWIKSMFSDVPKHSGYDTAGLERAVAYLDRLDDEISRAMRTDLEGKLAAEIVESIRGEIDKGIDLLEKRLDAVTETKRSSKKRKKTSSYEYDLVKEAQKITGVKGVYITAPLLISRIAKVCINGNVSGGHSIEDLFKKQCEEYGLNKREKAEVLELLDCMGYPVRMDRGFQPENQPEYNSEDKADMMTNFRG